VRVGCVFLEHFPLEVELRERPFLKGRVVVLGGEPWERKAVVDFSPEAKEMGVRAGMELRRAYQLCPEAIFLGKTGAQNRWGD